jgi:hypothetical protein
MSHVAHLEQAAANAYALYLPFIWKKVVLDVLVNQPAMVEGIK